MITAISLLCIVWPTHKLYREEMEKERRNERGGKEESDDRIISHPRGYWFSEESQSRAEQRAPAGIR